MKGNKDHNWYKERLKELKEEKKEVLKTVKKHGGENSGKVKSRKQLTQDFKREQRSFKRAEKQNWKKKVRDQIDGDE